jgi:hypothetical protein
MLPGLNTQRIYTLGAQSLVWRHSENTIRQQKGTKNFDWNFYNCVPNGCAPDSRLTLGSALTLPPLQQIMSSCSNHSQLQYHNFYVIWGTTIKTRSINKTHDTLVYSTTHRFSKAQDDHEPVEGNNIQPFPFLLIGWEEGTNLVHLSRLMTRRCSAGDVKRASYKSHSTPSPPPPPPNAAN